MASTNNCKDRTKTKANKDVLVSVFLTESTASLVNPKLPYLEDLHHSNDEEELHICTITPSETDYKSRKNKSEYVINTEESFDLSISSDVAYFTCGSMTSLPESKAQQSTDSTQIFPLKSGRPSLPYVLKPARIHLRPMMAVRTMAHDNRLSAHSNKIHLSLLDSDMSIASQYICRICHGGESVDDLLTPCRCRGTMALVHLQCLERWLLESSRSHCELCQHHYQVIREPKYNVLTSVVMYLKTPEIYMWELLRDVAAFVAYTPTAVASTYTLMIMCEALARAEGHKNHLPHVIGFFAVMGIAAIDFTYTTWLVETLQKHFEGWKEFRRNLCNLKIVLPNSKKRPRKMKRKS